MKQEQIKELLERIRSNKNNETNELVATAEAVSLLNATTEATMSVASARALTTTTISADNYLTLESYDENGNAFEEPIIGNYEGTMYALVGSVDMSALLAANNISASADLTACSLTLYGDAGNFSWAYSIYDVNGNFVGYNYGNGMQVAVPLKDAYDASGDWFFVLEPATGNDCLHFSGEGDLELSYNENPLVGISITTPPIKTAYLAGEKFDPTGMVVTATYSNGTTQTLTNYGYLRTSLTAGMTSITISYTDGDITKTATQAITVVGLSQIAVTTPPSKVNYLAGETFEPAGMVVTATYSDGSTKVVTEYTYSPNGVLMTSDGSITISYTAGGVTKTTTQAIMVNHATADFSSEYVTMTGLGVNEVGDEILTNGTFIGEGYGYTLVTQVEVDIAALCSSQGISKDLIEEVYLKLSGNVGSITYCEVDDEHINYKGTVQKIGNLYQIPLSLLKTGSTFPEVVTFHLWAPEAGTSEELTYVDLTIEEPADLVQINVAKAPTKTKYLVGGTFVSAGMVVTATYNDGSTREVTEYTYFPNGALSDSDNTVTISYGGKTATVQIVVEDEYETIDAGNIINGVYFDNPKIDLKTGKLIFVNPDASIGENSYEIGVSHIYHSQCDDVWSRAFANYGKGWKINLDQYLVKSSDGTHYKLIDDMGYTHVFEQFDGGRYYDKNDAGTVLEEVSDGALITDAKGNKIKFNALGRIAYTQAALNGAIKKIFEYDEMGRLVRVHDKRCEKNGSIEKYLEFSYNEKGLLSSIIERYPSWCKRIMFYYNNKDMLVYTDTMVEDSNTEPSPKKLINVYQYDDAENLIQISNQETKAAVRIGYESNRAKRIAKGIVSGGAQEISIGYTIETTFLEKSFQEVESTVLRSDNSLKEVKIVNERGIKSCLQFNTKNENISAFELDDVNKRTLSREYGVKLLLDGTSSDTINGERAKSISSGNSLNLTLSDITANRPGEDDYRNYSCSAWVKLASSSTKRVIAILTVQGQNSCVELDHTAVGVWQKVTLPVNFANTNARKNVAVKFEIKDMDGAVKSADVCCMRLYPGEGQKLFLNGSNLSDTMLNAPTTVKYTNTSGEVVNLCLSNGTYLTQNDFLRAVTEPANRNGSYDLICCGGTKRIANVNSLSCGSYQNLLSMDIAGDILYFENKSPDNNVRTRQYFKATRVSDKTKLEMEQEVISYKNGIDGNATLDDVRKVKTIAYDVFGRVTQEVDSYGLTTEYTYDNNVNDLQYGNVIRKTVKSSENQNKMLVYEYKYDEKGELISESTDGITSKGIVYKGGSEIPDSMVFGGKSDFKNLITSSGTPVAGKRKLQYQYDKYFENVESLTESGGNMQRQHTFTYENGALRTVTDGCFKYGYKNDIVNDKMEYTVFDGSEELVVLEKTTSPYSQINGEGKAEAKFFDADGNVKESVALTFDKYGKMTQSQYVEGASTKVVENMYEEVDGASKACANLTMVSSDCDNKTYHYNYDETGALVEWNVKKDNSNFLTAREIGVGETKYSFGSETDPSGKSIAEKYRTKIAYDQTNTIDPKVKQTGVYFDHDLDDDDDWTPMAPYFNDYEYDDFERIKKVKKKYNVLAALEAEQNDEYHYNDEGSVASPLVKEYTHERIFGDSNWTTVHTLGYDDEGRVKTTSESMTSNNTSLNYTCGAEYDYDEFGHIVEEELSGSSIVNSYEYDSQGRMVGRNDVVMEYYFEGKDKGKLAYVSTQGGYLYDHYGNRSALTDPEDIIVMAREYKYERGNLLTEIKHYGYPLVTYKYDHNGMRYEKQEGSAVTMYYNDGAKILGEDRNYGSNKVVKLRYFYNLTGLDGFSHTEDGVTKRYTYVRDLFGNVIAVEDETGKPIIRYQYDLLGKATSQVNVANHWFDSDENTGILSGLVTLEEWQLAQKVLKLNPFTWKGYYYDHESGYYYVSGRYYDPDAGVFIDAEDIEDVNTFGELSRQAITSDNYLSVEANTFSIATTDEMTVDKTYDPNENRGWWERNWLSVLLIGVQLVAGLIMCCIPCMQGVGVSLLYSAAFGALSMLAAELSPGLSKVLSGCSTISSGVSAISTGISLFACGPVGWVAGAICLAVGVATVAFGLNEAIEGITGVNAIREATRISQEQYEMIYLGLNIASTVCTLAGQAIRGFKGCRCFLAGTLVLTAVGYKAIEDIQIGDLVLAYDEETGERAYKPVVRLFRNESKDWTGVTVNGLEIVSTPGHKYFLPETKEWVSAEDLKIGVKVLLSDGSYGIIENVRAIHYDEPQTTYNFEVADFHTYYVGNGVLVHNMNGIDCGGKKEISTGNTKDYSVHESRRAAYRAAKRDAGVVSRQPTKVGLAKNRYGHRIPGKTYIFDEIEILWHSKGHPEYGMTRHFNFGDKHYFY